MSTQRHAKMFHGVHSMKFKTRLPTIIEEWEDQEFDYFCLQCFVRPANCGILPCGHCQFCQICVERYLFCPICYEEILSFVEVPKR